MYRKVCATSSGLVASNACSSTRGDLSVSGSVFIFQALPRWDPGTLSWRTILVGVLAILTLFVPNAFAAASATTHLVVAAVVT